MKVILLRDVAKIGRRSEVKEVPDGHAQNFLIPKKLAIAATKEALRRLEVEGKKQSILGGRHDAQFSEVLEALKDTPVPIAVKANEEGHLYKALHENDVVGALAHAGYTVSEKEVVIKESIKALGDHTITLRSGAKEGVMILRVTNA